MKIAPLSLPVFVSHHAIASACLRSRELAHASKLQVIHDVRQEVEAAIAAGRLSERKPNGRRASDSAIRFALSEDGQRCHVLRLVESDRDGLAWLAVTCFPVDEHAA